MNQRQGTYARVESSPPEPPSVEGVDVQEFMTLCARIAAASRVPGGEPADWKTTGRKAHAFSPEEDRVFAVMKELVQTLFDEHHLVLGKDYSIEEDAIGNLYVTYYGKNKERTIMVGSHGDSVDNGGQFDGAGGVVAGYQALKMCVTKPQKPECNVTLFVARAEESSPVTGKGMFGSGVAAGKFVGKAAQLNAMQHLVRGIPLSEHVGQERWQKILELAENPWIRVVDGKQCLCLPRHEPMSLDFMETHIEQGTILREQGKDVGIVSMIGGSVRWSVAKMVQVTDEQPELSKGYKRFMITITGEENHTGGTRQNPSAKQRNGEAWHRKDALVAASDFFCALRGTTLWKDMHVISTTTGGTPNFTTIPGTQTITLAGTDDAKAVLERLLAQCAKECGVSWEINMSALPEGVRFLGKELVENVMAIPRAVENIARDIAQQCTDCIGGPFRSTVTTLSIQDDGALVLNVDGRDIYADPLAKDAAITRIASTVVSLLQAANIHYDKLPELSRTPMQKMDNDMRKTAHQKAKELGIDAMELPSFPGHDAAQFAHALLLFIRQKWGKSHRPDEDLHIDNVKSALALYLSVGMSTLFPTDEGVTTL